jgi:multidrug efflux pump subunit AcrB
MLSARVVKAIKPGHHERLREHRVFGPIARFYDWLDAQYRVWLRWALDHRRAVVIAATALFAGALALMPLLGKEFLPFEDRGEFRLQLELPAGTSLQEMDRVSRLVEERLRQNPHVRRIYATLGSSEEVNRASMRVYTTKASERSGLTVKDIQDDVRRRLRDIPGLTYSVMDVQFLEMLAYERPISFYVRGEDYRELEVLARQALRIMQNTRGVKDAEMSLRPGKPEADVRVDRAQAADLGVSTGVVAQTIRLALEGDVVAKFQDRNRDIDVRLQLPPERRMSADSLGALTVPVTGRKVGANPLALLSGPRLVRVGDVSEVIRTAGPATIERMNRQRQIILYANLMGRSLGDTVDDIQAQLDKLPRPAGYTFVPGGQAKHMNETFDNLGLALIVAILFIYLVLASQFESFIHPVTIMVALPLAIVGALLALFIASYPMGMASLIGIILLMGLVTKNAILLVDFTNELRAKGKTMVEALLEAGPTRLRPILMTSAAMILGMLPTAMALGEGGSFRAPMALSVVAGVLASTVLTLLVVPVVYTYLDRFTLKGRRARAPQVAEAPVSDGARGTGT